MYRLAKSAFGRLRPAGDSEPGNLNFSIDRESFGIIFGRFSRRSCITSFHGVLEVEDVGNKKMALPVHLQVRNLLKEIELCNENYEIHYETVET